MSNNAMLPYNHQDMLACASNVVKAGLCGVQDMLYSPRGTGMLSTSGESWS